MIETQGLSSCSIGQAGVFMQRILELTVPLSMSTTYYNIASKIGTSPEQRWPAKRTDSNKIEAPEKGPIMNNG